MTTAIHSSTHSANIYRANCRDVPDVTVGLGVREDRQKSLPDSWNCIPTGQREMLLECRVACSQADAEEGKCSRVERCSWGGCRETRKWGVFVVWNQIQIPLLAPSSSRAISLSPSNFSFIIYNMWIRCAFQDPLRVTGILVGKWWWAQREGLLRGPLCCSCDHRDRLLWDPGLC